MGTFLGVGRSGGRDFADRSVVGDIEEDSGLDDDCGLDDSSDFFVIIK